MGGDKKGTLEGQKGNFEGQKGNFGGTKRELLTFIASEKGQKGNFGGILINIFNKNRAFYPYLIYFKAQIALGFLCVVKIVRKIAPFLISYITIIYIQ